MTLRRIHNNYLKTNSYFIKKKQFLTMNINIKIYGVLTICPKEYLSMHLMQKKQGLL